MLRMEKQKRGWGSCTERWRWMRVANQSKSKRGDIGHSIESVKEKRSENENENSDSTHKQQLTRQWPRKKVKAGKTAYIVYGLRTFNYDSQNGKTITEQIQHSKFVNNKNKQSHTTPNASQRLATPQQKG